MNRHIWLLACVGMLGSVALSAALLDLTPRAPDSLSAVWEIHSALVAMVVAPLLLALIFLLAQVSLEWGPEVDQKGDLDHLVSRKSQGLLARGLRRIADVATQTRRRSSTAIQARKVGDFPESALDRLTRVKNAGQLGRPG